MALPLVAVQMRKFEDPGTDLLNLLLEGLEEGGREERKEGGREGGKEGGREEGKEGGREGRKIHL